MTVTSAVEDPKQLLGDQYFARQGVVAVSAGGSMSDYDPENPYGLSAMERDVADLLVTGRDVRDVAVSLGLSTLAVAQLHEAARRKVGAQNDLHLAHLLAICRGSGMPKTDFVFLDV